MCGLGNPLTDHGPVTAFGEPIPALAIPDRHNAGNITAVVVAVWSLAIGATFIGLVGGMGLVADIIKGLNKEKAKEVDLEALILALAEHEEMPLSVFQDTVEKVGH